MIRSESTRALGQPRLTSPILGCTPALLWLIARLDTPKSRKINAPRPQGCLAGRFLQMGSGRRDVAHRRAVVVFAKLTDRVAHFIRQRSGRGVPGADRG